MKIFWTPFFQSVEVSGRLFHPKVVFSSEERAKEWISEQPGYGLGTDWFLRELIVDPE